MQYLKKTIIPILIIGVWINIFETVRWLLIIESYWIEFYTKLNLVFPNEPINGLIWMTWGFLLATIIFLLSKKFTSLQTTIITWLAVFFMLWIVLWNINILPLGILLYVVPLSFIEIYIGVIICKKLI